jgi:hypothetical protein
MIGHARILVCGSRDFVDEAVIREELARLSLRTTIIHGAAPGADTLADRIAKELGLRVRPFPADWDRYGDSAGPIRNQQMLDEGKPSRAIAFVRGLLRNSRGTRDMVKRAHKAGIQMRVIEVPR